MVNANKCGFDFWIYFFFLSNYVILVKLYNTVMNISLKSHLNPAVQIFHFLQPSYPTLLSYGAKFLCSAWFHGRILCMNTDIHMADVLCVSIFCFPFKNCVMSMQIPCTSIILLRASKYAQYCIFQ